MKLNIGKTKFIKFNHKRKRPEQRIVKLDNKLTSEVREFKYLGVTLDTCFTYRIQVENQRRKAITPVKLIFPFIAGTRDSFEK